MKTTIELVQTYIKRFAEDNPDRADPILDFGPNVLRSKGFEKIATAVRAEDPNNAVLALWRLLALLAEYKQLQIMGRHTPNLLRADVARWKESRHEVEVAVKVLREYAKEMQRYSAEVEDDTTHGRTTPAVALKVAADLEYFGRIEEDDEHSGFLGKKAGFKEFVIRAVAHVLPEFVGRPAAIAEVMTIAGFGNITRQLVDTTLREATRRPRKTAQG